MRTFQNGRNQAANFSKLTTYSHSACLESACHAVLWSVHSYGHSGAGVVFTMNILYLKYIKVYTDQIQKYVV